MMNSRGTIFIVSSFESCDQKEVDRRPDGRKSAVCTRR